MPQLTYCRRMAETCGAEVPPVITSRALQHHAFAALRLQIDRPSLEKTEPLAINDGFIASVAFQKGYKRERWMDGKPAQEGDGSGGATSLMDLRRVNQARFLSPVDCIQFHYPTAALRTVAETNDLVLKTEMRSELCVMFKDDVLERLATALLHTFDRPEEASLVYVDHILMASSIHMIVKHFAARQKASPHKGGLAPWQQRRVLELLDAHLSGEISIQNLADACQLSVRHFTRAFTQTNGQSPHRWMIGRRIDRAKELLVNSTIPIDEVARETCFASQSHFTRTFTAIVGESPAAWRRVRCRRTYRIEGSAG